jgi:sn-glycerol 3-phosphate transport system ATP-binding protein
MHRPATTFVAGFIGSPPMNLLKGPGGQLALHRRRPDAAAAGRRAALGRTDHRLRPEHAALRPGLGWPFRVEMTEMLGAERLVHGRLGSTLFTVRIDATLIAPRVGETLTLQGPPPHLHWFDAATQQRVA